MGLETYLRNTDDALFQLVLQHETKKKLYAIQKEAEKFRREFEVPNLDRATNERVTKFARRVKQRACQHYSIEVPQRWYEHKPETVTENEEVTILWDMQIHTDRKLSANKPDKVIKDHANRCCKHIDVSVPSDGNT
ncbi:unnamed protein product [Porites evermanni]|uniref:Uncharacterized protein n=1 Tax=Porites evermanni TaxID=104178 RepID=A0ABN8SFD2_9CNID|nr:unnamed protein product [Porites evermanni]